MDWWTQRAPGHSHAGRGDGRPSVTELFDDLHALIDEGRRVYLHCNAGLNRAPTIAIAHMRAHRNMSLDEAVAYVKARRACGPFMTVLEERFGARHLKNGG